MSVNSFEPQNFKGFELFPGEEVRFVMRKHWAIHLIHFWKWVFWGIGGGLICAFLGYFMGMDLEGPGILLLGATLLVYLAIVTLYFFVGWLNDILDVIVVTNDRVVDITQVDLFHRNIIETRLENVQDAMGTVKGFLNTLFDWGEVRIRTANDVADFFIDMIPDPHTMARQVFNLANEAKKREQKAFQAMGRPKTPEDRQEKYHQKISDIFAHEEPPASHV